MTVDTRLTKGLFLIRRGSLLAAAIDANDAREQKRADELHGILEIGNELKRITNLRGGGGRCRVLSKPCGKQSVKLRISRH